MSAEVLPGWTGWRPLPLGEPMTAADLAESVDGGQSFRWSHGHDGAWTGLWTRHIVRLHLKDGVLRWSTPRSIESGTEQALLHYLDAASTAASRTDALPWRSDAHLARCLEAYPGVRLLKQDLGEALLGFLCSATKQIVQIKQMLALVAERHGVEIAKETPGIKRLPNWTELASVSEAELRRCLLGFRAAYVHNTARFIADRPGWLDETGRLPYPEAKARLCILPGVGEKVADCVLLFGGDKPEAFPVDVWILKALANRYGLVGWSPKQLAQFGRAHFGAQAGLAQQFLFAWERRLGRSTPPSGAPAKPKSRR